MILSLVKPKTSPKALQELMRRHRDDRHPDELWHSLLYELADGNQKCDEGRLLYRVEDEFAVVRSPERLRDVHDLTIVDDRKMEVPDFKVGERFGFRVRVCCEKRIAKSESNRRHSIHEIADGDMELRDEHAWWWISNEDRHRGAYELQRDQVRIGNRRIYTLRNRKVDTLEYEGVLTVANPEAMERIYRFGIGSQKGHGCGLIDISKV